MIASRNQNGFSHVELLIVVVVVAALGLAGFTFMNRQKTETARVNPAQAQVEQSTADVPAAPEIKKASDLNKAEQVLGDSELSASDQDLDELEKELNSF